LFGCRSAVVRQLSGECLGQLKKLEGLSDRIEVSERVGERASVWVVGEYLGERVNERTSEWVDERVSQ